MNRKLALICLVLTVAITASSQRQPTSPSATPKPLAARFMVQGTYEEIYQGRTSQGAATGKLVIKFEAGRDRKSTRLNSSHERLSRMPSSA